MPFSTAERLAKLREHMAAHRLDCYIVASDDAHHSEIPCEADERRRYISDFTGSAGTAIVDMSEAHLWVDGRYFLQSDKQLDPGLWEAMKLGTPGCPRMSEFIRKRQFTRVGFDPYVTIPAFLTGLSKALPESVKLVAVHQGTHVDDPSTEEYTQMSGADKGQKNLVDLVWEADGTRPAYPSKPLIQVLDAIAGETVVEKLHRIREALKEKKCAGVVMGDLSDIAWTFNLRGSDSSESRLFMAYAMVTMGKAEVFVKHVNARNRVDRQLLKQMDKEGIVFHPYEEFVPTLAAFLPTIPVTETVWIDSSVNSAVATLCKAKVTRPSDAALKPVEAVTPAHLFKAVKNTAELTGMIQAHVEDGAAVSLYLAWLESLGAEELTQHTEWTVAERLEAYRLMQPGFIADSFKTISSMDANSAVIHYSPTEVDNAPMNPNGVYLVDSGGHYVGGTTDVTRTIHLGTPSAWEREVYTRVLKGHVCLAMAKFKEGIRGCQLDLLARQPLLAIGMDYLHGTGHGVGHSLCVHEDPPFISNVVNSEDRCSGFQRNMVVSNEPGCYIDGQFGVRIENVQYCKENVTPHKFNGSQYVEFEQLTLVPYSRRMIELSLLSNEEVHWINSYHNRVQQRLTAYIENSRDVPAEDRSRVVAWLKGACRPL